MVVVVSSKESGFEGRKFGRKVLREVNMWVSSKESRFEWWFLG